MQSPEDVRNDHKIFKFCFNQDPEIVGHRILRPSCPKFSILKYQKLSKRFEKLMNSEV